MVARRKGRKLHKPDKVHVTEDENGVIIRFRWLENLNGLMITVGVMLLLITAVLFAAGIGIIGEGGLGAAIIGFGMLALGLGSIYMFMSIPLDSTVIRLTDETLSHTNEPLYAFDNHQFRREDVHQVIAEDASPDGTMDGYSNLMVIMRDGRKRKLAQFLQTDYALYIVQMLSEYFEEESVYADALGTDSRLNADEIEGSLDMADTHVWNDEQQTASQA